MPIRPMIEDFSPGYMRRALQLFPRQSDRDPWRNTQNYQLDKEMIRNAPLEDGVLVFGMPPSAQRTVEVAHAKIQSAA